MEKDWLANAYEGMSRRQFLALMGATGIGLAGFAIAAGPVAGEIITTTASGLITADTTVASGDFRIPVYEAYPEAPGKYPVVIVIPEIFGMHEHIRDITRRFAKKGFFSITFDPYAREGGVSQIAEISKVLKVANAVPDGRVMADLDALVTYARQHRAARGDRIGVTGFCRGGMYALLFAAHSKEIKAAVSWYGQIRPEKRPGIRTNGPIDLATQISAPVLGLYGVADLGIPADDVKDMETALRSAGKTAEFILYPGAPHAFFADYRPGYRAEAAKDAWARCLTWFNRHLKG
ncbi:MAG: dienelactone hydrolase family protein [Thermodesulfovibrionales bacterium]|jgi:carboxymethylenebutenolidase